MGNKASMPKTKQIKNGHRHTTNSLLSYNGTYNINNHHRRVSNSYSLSTQNDIFSEFNKINTPKSVGHQPQKRGKFGSFFKKNKMKKTRSFNSNMTPTENEMQRREHSNTITSYSSYHAENDHIPPISAMDDIHELQRTVSAEIAMPITPKMGNHSISIQIDTNPKNANHAKEKAPNNSKKKILRKPKMKKLQLS